MENVIREALYVYAVDVDTADAQKFVYRGATFRWCVKGCHVSIARYRFDGSSRITFWHNVTPVTLWPKISHYLQRI
jgi:hypothetical protein